MDEKFILKTFGLNLKIYRNQLNISQDEMSIKTGFSKSYISKIENGKCNLSFTNAVEIAHAIGKNISEMLREL